MDNKVKFYEKNWFMWFAMIVFAPAGVFLMWKYKRFGKVPRAIISCVFAIWFIAIVSSCQLWIQSNNAAIAQNQIQTQVNEQITTDKKLATDLDARIVALGDTKTIVLDQSDDVMAIRTAYDELSTQPKGFVTKLKLLTAAEKTITELQLTADRVAEDKATADQAAVDKVAAQQAAADKIATDQAAADKVAADKNATDQAASQSQAVASSPSVSQTQNNEETVYTTRTGSKYHGAGCRYLRQSQIAISLSDAISQGLTPCSVCNP